MLDFLPSEHLSFYHLLTRCMVCGCPLGDTCPESRNGEANSRWATVRWHDEVGANCKIRAANTNQEKMRELYEVLHSGGDKIKSELNNSTAPGPSLTESEIKCLLFADDLVILSKTKEGLQQLLDRDIHSVLQHTHEYTYLGLIISSTRTFNLAVGRDTFTCLLRLIILQICSCSMYYNRLCIIHVLVILWQCAGHANKAHLNQFKFAFTEYYTFTLFYFKKKHELSRLKHMLSIKR